VIDYAATLSFFVQHAEGVPRISPCEDTVMDKSPLPSLEDLFVTSVDCNGYRAAVGIPHPMVRFTSSGSLMDSAYADAIVGFIVDSTLEAETERCKTAVWFLLESEQAFFVICKRAGIDADRLRQHLRKQIP
jgi:hypothetical protein